MEFLRQVSLETESYASEGWYSDDAAETACEIADEYQQSMLPEPGHSHGALPEFSSAGHLVSCEDDAQAQTPQSPQSPQTPATPYSRPQTPVTPYSRPGSRSHGLIDSTLYVSSNTDASFYNCQSALPTGSIDEVGGISGQLVSCGDDDHEETPSTTDASNSSCSSSRPTGSADEVENFPGHLESCGVGVQAEIPSTTDAFKGRCNLALPTGSDDEAEHPSGQLVSYEDGVHAEIASTTNASNGGCNSAPPTASNDEVAAHGSQDKFNMYLPAAVSSNVSATNDAVTVSQQMPDRENSTDWNAGTMCGASDELDAQDSAAEVVGHEDSDRKPDKHSIDAISFERGDLVLLHEGVPQEFRNHHAIVTIAHDSHCTVVVLDDVTQTGVGECWPSFHDMSMESSMLRLGTQVVVTGMSGARTKHLNGLTGVVAEHPREGHPTFIRRPKCPEKPQLTVCIRFTDPSAANQSSALLEPRFLEPFDDVAIQTARRLSEVMESLQ
jgi:hypothetical protein